MRNKIGAEVRGGFNEVMSTANCLCWDPHYSGTGVAEDVQEHSLWRAELGAYT